MIIFGQHFQVVHKFGGFPFHPPNPGVLQNLRGSGYLIPVSELAIKGTVS